jgi:negative regulator of sigma E activity
MKDLADVKFKQVSEDGNRKIATFKQEIDQQLRLANDNLIRSEDKTKDMIQELYELTESKIGQHNQEL